MRRVIFCALVAIATIAVPASASTAEVPTTSVPTAQCKNWNFKSKAHQGQRSYGPRYTVKNDVWNPLSISQTLYSCNFDSFYVEANVHDKDGAVQSYPSSQFTFGSPIAVSRFSSLTSAFRFSKPPKGHGLDYEAAYDLWINGYGGNGHTEMMIWTYDDRQRPAGRELSKTISIGGRAFTVWTAGTLGHGGDIVTFEATHNYVAGQLNLMPFLNYAAERGWLKGGKSAALWQVDFGAELCATAGLTRFDFTDFNLAFKT
jgi:Glycosyl hydrolase family 12